MKSIKKSFVVCAIFVSCIVPHLWAIDDAEFEGIFLKFMRENGSMGEINEISQAVSGDGAIAVVYGPGETASSRNFSCLLRCRSGGAGVTRIGSRFALRSEDYPECEFWITSVAPPQSAADRFIFVSAGMIDRINRGRVTYKWMELDTETGRISNFPSLDYYKASTFVTGDATADVIMWYPAKNIAVFNSRAAMAVATGPERVICFSKESGGVVSVDSKTGVPQVTILELEFSRWLAAGGGQNNGETQKGSN